MTEEPTYMEVPPDAPSAYWEGWAEEVGVGNPHGIAADRRVTLRTLRTGRDGRSDAKFVIDRLASGLYFGRVL